MQKYKVFILVIACFLVNTKIFSERNNDSRDGWDSKKFSIGFGAGVNYHWSLTPNFEFPIITYMPVPEFHITLKGFPLPTDSGELNLNSSLLFGTSIHWGSLRWYINGGMKIRWIRFSIGPEISTGIEYLLLEWLAWGLKLNGSIISGPYGVTGGVGEEYINPFESSALLTVNFVF